MGASPEELTRDIERTRDELGGTLDAIGEKVDDLRERSKPANLVRTKAAKVAGGVLLGLFLLRRLGRRRKQKRNSD